MHITSGIYKGIPLSTPKGENTRPTLGKTRQAVFNMLRPYLDGSVFLDLFSGTGAFGFEALSNGASRAVFVDARHGDLIRKNAEKLRVPPNCYRYIRSDASQGIDTLSRENFKADIVFADPPYNKGFIRTTLKKLETSDILKPGADVIIELHLEEKDEVIPYMGAWQLFKEKKYGDTFVLMLKKKEA